MKANNVERILSDQIFKISKSDENISDYLIDCGSPFNCPISNKEVEGFSNGTCE